jgi:amino acid transporter
MSRLHLSTPCADGFRMPGAIEPKTRCWMIWPERTDEYPFGARPAQKAYARVATAIAALALVATVLTVLLQVILKKPPLLSSVYLANLSTYYWLAPYFLVCLGIIRVIRRERGRAPATVGAACVAMVAIAYVSIEMYRSPVDAGTKYLPYLALVSIVMVALAFLTTRRDIVVPESELEQL